MSSIREYNESLNHAQYMRGVITKTQRMLQYLKHYDSSIDPGDSGKGFRMKVMGSDPKVNLGYTGKISLNSERWNEVQRQLAKDIQDIVDSSTGFDSRRFGRVGDENIWLNKFLFGDNYYEGVFKIESWDGKRFSGSEKITNPVHQDVIKAALEPYKTMLQLGTNVYEAGNKKSVKYRDIIDYMHEYDRDVSSLSQTIYNKLKYRNRNATDYVNTLDQMFAVKKVKLQVVHLGSLVRMLELMLAIKVDYYHLKDLCPLLHFTN